jgi:hypothetical protein
MIANDTFDILLQENFLEIRKRRNMRITEKKKRVEEWKTYFALIQAFLIFLSSEKFEDAAHKTERGWIFHQV